MMIVKTETSVEHKIKYLNINVSKEEIERNPDVVRLCDCDADMYAEYVKPCDDCISRAKVEEITWDVPIYADAFNVLVEVRDRVRALPSVTPQHSDAEIQKIQELEQAEIQKAYELGKAEQPYQRTGRWNYGDNMFEYAICSECKWDSREAWDYAKKNFDFCPNCGAKMEVEE